MDSLIFRDSLPLANEASVRIVEEKIGGVIPAEYCEFLLQTNGGKPQPAQVTVPQFGDSMVEVLFGCGSDSEYDLEYHQQRYDLRVPKEYLPIGFDSAGNLFILKIKGERIGEVAFWFHEQESDDGTAPTTDNIYPIANSFNAFLEGFSEPEALTFGEITDLIHRGDFEEIKSLLESGWDVNSDLNIGGKAIHRVLLIEDLDRRVFDLIISYKPDLSGSIEKAWMYHPELIPDLIEAGADVNEKDDYGTPLLTAAIVDENMKAAMILIRNGADITETDEFGDTALEVAKLKYERGVEEAKEVIQLLEERME